MSDCQSRRRVMLAVAAALLLPSAAPVQAATEEAAVAPIQLLVDGLVEIMKAGPGHPIPAALRDVSARYRPHI